jgi:cobalt/nickel transport system permease protein
MKEMSGLGRRRYLIPSLMTMVMIFPTIFLFGFAMHASVLRGEEKWPGVDKAVVEKFATEHGREAKRNLINTDQGDLLLFVFLIAGAAGGFAGGYYWRILVERKPKSRE